MPNIYLSNELYDEIVRKGKNVTNFVRDSVKKSLKELD